MKFKKESRKVTKNVTSANDKVVISSEYYENDRPSYICSICNQSLIRLTDAGQNNQTYWCRNCSIEYDPEAENLRKETKLKVPERNVEPCVSTAPGIPDISLHKEPELRGGFAQLAKEGTIRFIDYHTTEKE